MQCNQRRQDAEVQRDARDACSSASSRTAENSEGATLGEPGSLIR